MKRYNILNGIFYTLYGLFGAVLPKAMANVMGWTPSLLGFHQIRAVSMAMALMGILAVLTARKSRDQAPLVMTFIILTLAFAAGRILGLMFDGLGPVQTYAEIAFEVFWASVGFIILKRRSALPEH